jgi:hypothetical protein
MNCMPTGFASPIDRSVSPIRSPRRLPLAFALAALVALAGACGDSGGGSGGGNTSAGAAGPQKGTASQAHWSAALAALGSGYTPAAPRADAAAFSAWSRLLAQTWPGVRAIFEPPLEAALHAQLTSLVSSSPLILGYRDLRLDLTAPPVVSPASAGPGGLAIRHELPGAPMSWSAHVTLDVGVQVQQTILGIPVTVAPSIDVSADVLGLRAVQTLELDVTDPRRPWPNNAPPPQVDLRIALSSTSSLLNQVSGAINQALDPVLRAAIAVAAVQLRQQALGVISQVPQQAWGLGAPPPTPIPGPFDLDVHATTRQDDVERYHIPFNNLVSVWFDQPGYGNGAPERYDDFGDSGMWSGCFLASQVLRFELTGDAQALALSQRLMEGFTDCVQVNGPANGPLARCVVPLTSPRIVDIQHGTDYATGISRGVAYGALNNVSRDQYLGFVHGALQTWLRVPSLRAQAGDLISRAVGYLEANGWNGKQVTTHEVSAPFGQTPGVLWSMIKAAAATDPGRWQAAHDAAADVTGIFWYETWTSVLEVFEQHYKFNLGHIAEVIRATVETDPARYRDYARDLEIHRGAIGHYRNAWFDAIYGGIVPAAAPLVAPVILDSLERFTRRPRRVQPVTNSTDPSIRKVTYNSPLLPNGPLTVAAYPLPVDRQLNHTNFLWQRHPFKLDDLGDPRQQHAGTDYLLPLWYARSYGMLP